MGIVQGMPVASILPDMGDAELAAVKSQQTAGGGEVVRLRDVSADQWRSGVAAWLGWTFDGLDMHLYTLVALPFVAELLQASEKDDIVGRYSSWIQAAFMIGWALGGGLFGYVGDRLGRTWALMLTIFTYAMFTGLSFFATQWWHLLIFRFLAALGIGGEWAVGASLLAETWPRKWKPWLAAVLQSGVNVGILCASGIYFLLVWGHLPNRSVFLVGVLPALLVLWIRRSVPESEEWQAARSAQAHDGADACVGACATGGLSTSVIAGELPVRGALAGKPPVAQEPSLVRGPGIADLFRGEIRRTTLLTILVCSLSLTAHWAFMFWSLQQFRNLPSLRGRDAQTVGQLVSIVFMLLMVTSIIGNFLAAMVARRLGYRRVIVLGSIVYFMVLTGCYCQPRSHNTMWAFLAAIGMCSGFFALFTMYLPPLFPTLLRTTGAGFCYNIGRIAAGFGTVFFGLFSNVGDYRLALLYAGFLFIPAAMAAWFLPDLADGVIVQRRTA
jgi:MFS family permease